MFCIDFRNHAYLYTYSSRQLWGLWKLGKLKGSNITEPGEKLEILKIELVMIKHLYTKYQINICKHEEKSLENWFDGLTNGQTDRQKEKVQTKSPLKDLVRP